MQWTWNIWIKRYFNTEVNFNIKVKIVPYYVMALKEIYVQ